MILSPHMNAHGYTNVGRVEFMDHLAPYLSHRGHEQVEFAYPISKYAHRPQVRDDGRRYFEHPKTVAWLIFDRYQIYSWRAIVIALLHDIIEDSFLMNEERIRLNFGKRVARAVVILSKNTISPELLQKNDGIYYQRFLSQGDWECLLVKVVDRIHNLSTLADLPPERQERKIRETERFFPSIIMDLAEKIPPGYFPQVECLRQDLATLCCEGAQRTRTPDGQAFAFELAS